MEGTLEFSKLKPRDDIVGYGPMVSIVVDIETTSGRGVKQHLKQRKFPPPPSDEIITKEEASIPLDDPSIYAELLNGIKTKIITKELEAAEQAIRVANTAKVKVSVEELKNRAQIENRQQVPIKAFLSKQETAGGGARRKRPGDLARQNLDNLFLDSDDDDDEKEKDETKTEPKKKEGSENKDDGKEYDTLQYWPDPNNDEDCISTMVSHLHIFGDKQPVMSIVHAVGDSLPLKFAKNTVTYQVCCLDFDGVSVMEGLTCDCIFAVMKNSGRESMRRAKRKCLVTGLTWYEVYLTRR